MGNSTRSTRQSRVQRGVPAGGQFTGRQRDEAVGIDLEDPDVYDTMGQASGYWARRYGLESDEILSEATLDLLEDRERRAAAANREPVRNPGGYANTAVAHAAVRIRSGRKSSADKSAWSKWRRTCEAKQQELGRELTPVEEDQIAEEIRMSAPPRRRPTPGFHVATHKTSLENELGNERSDLPAATLTGEPVPSRGDGWEPSDVFSREDSAAADVAWDALKEGGRAGNIKARDHAWKAVAATTGAPSTVAESITEPAAKKTRDAIADAGGALRLAAGWRAGRLDDRQTAALFVAFGGDQLDDTDRDAVVDTLEAFPGYADELLAAAVSHATKRRRR